MAAMTPARLKYYRNPNYLTWLHAEAAEIDADGCSGVTGVMVECCEQHDIEGYYGKDARSAYRKMKQGHANYWELAEPITFQQWNAHFRRCLQARSRCGLYSPMALWRWLGVTFLGRKAWKAHRERQAKA